MADQRLVVGNLVRWVFGPSNSIGVVVETERGGHQLKVRLNAGREMTFAWPTDALVRLVFEPGSQVEVAGDDSVGVVTGAADSDGVRLYHVSLPGGVQKTVLESGLRPALITDPIALVRARQLQSARSCNLRLTATRLLYAHKFDELSSLSNSRVEIKPHQVGVVHRVATTYPHRFLLADEVGLGKTIEAGLIIKELKARGVANRVLILAPSGIVGQWQFEMKTKFNQIFAHYNRASIAYLQANHPGDNVWTLSDDVIVSTSYAAWDDKRHREIALAGWDLVVIDEAHHARRQWEGESRYRETRLYELAAMLADPEMGRSLGFLLLTATPMQLHSFELYSLIELLDPALFPTFADFEAHRRALAGLNATVDAVRRWHTLPAAEQQSTLQQVSSWLGDSLSDLASAISTLDGKAIVTERLLTKHRLSEVLIRNRKAVVGGFMPRVAAVWPVEMTPQEREAYQATTDYLRRGYAHAERTRNNALGFLMAIFQKLNSSSSFALRQSLLRRIEKLESGIAPDDVPEVGNEDEELEERPLEDSLGNLLGIPERMTLADEIHELARIVQLLDAITLDSKAMVLTERLDEILREDAAAKVIIFTQFRDTQEYIRRVVPKPWQVEIFHGQLKPEEKDAAVSRFRETRQPTILVSTEAGGEGRNFQFCHILINYDLPWNPMKIEQRIGRLDRLGQGHPVKVFNFSVTDTIEERVLQVLTNRIRVFEETIGGLDPILGNVESDLKRVFLLADEEAQHALERLDRQLESRVRAAHEAERRLADLIMDTKSFRQDEVRELLDRKGVLDKDALRRFVINALAELNVLIEDHPDIAGTYTLKLRGQFLSEYPQFAKEGVTRHVTFDPAVARDFETIEFLAFGHELVDALVDRVRDRAYGGRTSHRIVRNPEQPPRQGWLFTYTLEFDGVVSSKEVLAVFVDLAGEHDPDLARWLVELAGRGKREEWGTVEAPEPGEAFDVAVATASRLASARLIQRQTELSVLNREHLQQEREKLERFYDYRLQAATEKLEAVRRTFERLSSSEDPEVQRIIPVWAKNLENAKRMLDGVQSERVRRLGDLAGRDHVTAQQELLTVSFVDIRPD